MSIIFVLFQAPFSRHLQGKKWRNSFSIRQGTLVEQTRTVSWFFLQVIWTCKSGSNSQITGTAWFIVPTIYKVHFPTENVFAHQHNLQRIVENKLVRNFSAKEGNDVDPQEGYFRWIYLIRLFAAHARMLFRDERFLLVAMWKDYIFNCKLKKGHCTKWNLFLKIHWLMFIPRRVSIILIYLIIWFVSFRQCTKKREGVQ